MTARVSCGLAAVGATELVTAPFSGSQRDEDLVTETKILSPGVQQRRFITPNRRREAASLRVDLVALSRLLKKSGCGDGFPICWV